MMKHLSTLIRSFIICVILGVLVSVGFAEAPTEPQAQIAFQQGYVSGITGIGNPTTLQFGPDERLYVAERFGKIYALTIERNGPGDYSVVSQEVIDLITQIPNRTDTGEIDTSSQFLTTARQVTGLVVTGSATNPVLYVSSSDPREGGGTAGTETNLDTNSGIVSRLTWNGTSWDHLQLVRGLPRSEENHAVNGLDLDEATNTLYLAVGGFTNMGAPSFNFTYISEYAYAAAIVSIDLNAIGDTTYDMPTLDDPTRPNNPDGSDLYDPFGGNDGLNQARIDPSGPVQIYASGFRNPYDLVLTEAGRMYTVDNGPNYTWGGPPVNQNPGECDETINEDGSETYYDNLHFVSGAGYYGGHPAPVRANPQGIFGNESDSPVPFALANPVECDYRIPGVEDGALATWITSTNGITEYTATNFTGAMQGDLLTVSYDGNVYRMKPTVSGDGLVDLTPNDTGDWGYVAEFGGFGTVPLDVTTQGDNDIFPGTIWVAVFVDKSIAVFEPVDFPCTGDYDITLDEDGDGYSNADEIDNGTNPCSNGSKPPDNDKDNLSDLNDTDDDNDGIPDLTDAFQIDAQNGTQTTLPVIYDFFQDAPGTGFFGVGFTGLMVNGTTDYLDMYELAELTIGGTAGKATVDNFTSGTAYGNSNTQDYAFQWGVNVTQADGAFGLNSQMNNPFFSPAPEAGDEQGIYFGTGDQDNYFQLALAADDTTGTIGFEVIVENAGAPLRTFYPVADATSSPKINLYISVDPVNGTAQPKYSLNGQPFIELGNPITLTGALLDVVQTDQVMAVGLMANFAPTSTAFGGTWDNFFIEREQPGVLGVNPNPLAFSEVVQDTFVEETVTLQNYGQIGDPDITVSGVAVSGSTEFSITTDPTPIVLAPGSTTNVVIRYQPTDVGMDTATLTVTHDGINTPTSIALSGTGIVDFDPLYRVNIGGSELNDPEGVLNWSADNGTNPSPYANHAVSGSTLTSTGAVIDYSNATLPTYTPVNLFNTGRWDPNNGAENEMIYDFPVTDGRYEVRLYFAETFSNTATVGARVWDAELEGTVPTNFDDIDRFALAGFNAGYMLAAETDVNDGSLTVRFIHQVENPELQGVEIYPVFIPPTSDLSASTATLDFGGIDVGASSNQTLTLTNAGTATDPSITITSLTYSGAHATDFNDDFAGPVTLQPGESTSVTVTATATGGGSRTASLTINHDGGNAPTEVSLTATAYQSNVLDVSPNPIEFGQVDLETSATRPLTLTNLGGPGDPDIEILDLIVTGSNTYQFQFEPYTEPLIIPAGQSATVAVTFSPAQIQGNSVTLAISHTGTNSPATTTATGAGIEASSDPLYRINVGGATVTDPAGILDWSADNASNPSPYLIAGGNNFSSTGASIDMSSATLPADTPASLFTVERWDPNDGPENAMTYEFPVPNGSYEVRLYIAEIYSGITAAGQRVFDASVESAIPTTFEDIDPFALAGANTGFMLSAQTDVSDGALTLVLTHQTENPALKAIEIVPTGPAAPTSELTANPATYDFGSTDINGSATQSISLTNNGATDAPAINITGITFEGTGAGSFNSNFTGTETLQPGETTSVDVTFTPTDMVTYNVSMVVANDGENAPLRIPLTGFGSSPGVLTQDTAALDFGTIVLGDTSSNTLTVTNLGNTGDPDITITELNISGTSAAEFTHGATLPITVSPTTSATIDLAFTPTTAGNKIALLTIISDGTQGDLTVDLTGIGEDPPAYGDVIYRVNVGGPSVTDPAGVMDWEADDSTNPSPYRLAGNAGYSSTGNAIDMTSPTIPVNTPMSLFQTERWDPDSGDEMSYAFPVTTGDYEVRLYLAELYSGIGSADQRVFDASLEGVVPTAFEDIDIFAAVGFESAYVVSAKTAVTDGNLTLEFLHQVENPAIKAIEILPVSTTQASNLDVSLTSYDFGAITKDTTATQQIVLTNAGATDAAAITLTDVTFDDVAYSSDFTGSATLNPGDNLTITVTFSPDSHGESNAVMTIAHDGANAPNSVTFTGSGVAPDLNANPVSYDFGSVDVNTSATQVIQLENTGAAGEAAIDITDVTFSGTHATDLSSDFAGITTLQPGETLDITINFTPTQALSYAVDMSVAHDGANAPLVIALTGSGYDLVSNLTISPTGIDFGSTDIDVPETQAITFTNEGPPGAPAITISEISFTDVVFTTDATLPLTLNPGESIMVNVSFAPADLIAYDATMTVTHDGNNSPTSETVSGVGTAPGDLMQDVTSLDFGTVTLGESSTNSVTITNLGGTGDPDVTITALDITGVDMADFNHNDILPLVINAGSSTVIDLTFTPVTAGSKTAQLTISHDGDNSPLIVDLTGTANEAPTYGDPLYRVNVGGGTLTDPAGILDWSEDTGSAPSPYLIAGGNGLSGAGSVDTTDPSIPTNTPPALFSSERWDPSSGSEMTYEFPVTNATYLVRVYLAETYSGITNTGQRVFDIELENTVPTPFDDVDQFAIAGSLSGFTLSSEIEVVDSALTVRFLHVTENPALKGIEVIPVNGTATPQAILGADPVSVDFGDVQVGNNASQAITLSNDGVAGAPALTISSISFGDAVFSSDFVAPVTLNAGESTTVNVTFSPLTASGFNTNMTIAHDGDGGTLDVALVGRGSQAGTLSQDANAVDFGTVITNNSVSGNVTVTNMGTSGDPDIIITALDVTGASAAEFSYSETLPLTVAPGTSDVIDLSFLPTSAGDKSATLTIVNDGVQGNLTVNLTGSANDPAPESASAIIRIETGGDIATSSTYNPSFYIENTSTAGQTITRVRYNISTALVPDVVFDPLGTAGDTGSRCLFPVSDKATATGFIEPADLCADPFFEPYELGYNGIEVMFNDFNVGEDFLFGVDIDPISTRGTFPPGPDDAASISGYELIGSVVTIEFSDSTILTTQPWRYNSSVTGSQNIARSNTITPPSIEVLGISGATATVSDLNQTVRVTGPVDAAVSLLISEGFMIEQSGGGYDVDPYELNTILNVAEYSVTIGSSGTIDIPITLLDDKLIDGTYGGLNYITAVVRDGDQTSDLSNRIKLEYIEATTPSITLGSDLTFDAQEGQGLVESNAISTGTSDNSTPNLNIAVVDDATGLTPTWMTIPTTITAGNPVTVSVDAIGLTPGTYTATVTASASGYTSASATVTLVVNDITISISSPLESDVITGDTFTVTWTSTGGLADDHVHVTLDDLSTTAVEPHVGSLPQNDSYTFTSVQPGDYAVIVTMANVNHIVYQGVGVSVNVTVEAATINQSGALPPPQIDSSEPIEIAPTASPTIAVEEATVTPTPSPSATPTTTPTNEPTITDEPTMVPTVEPTITPTSTPGPPIVPPGQAKKENQQSVSGEPPSAEPPVDVPEQEQQP